MSNAYTYCCINIFLLSWHNKLVVISAQGLRRALCGSSWALGWDGGNTFCLFLTKCLKLSLCGCSGRGVLPLQGNQEWDIQKAKC